MLNEVMNPVESLHKSEVSCPDSPYSVYDDDLAYIISQEENETEYIHLGKFIEHMKEFDIGPVGICAICDKHYTFGGHNPYPVIKDEGARCCTCCYDEIVKKARREMTSEILNASKGRKPSNMLRLHSNPNIIVNYIRKFGIIRAIAAPKVHGGDKATFDFVDAKYRAPFLIFKQADSDNAVVLDIRKITMSEFIDDHMLLIYVEDELGAWKFCPHYDESVERNFLIKANDPLHPLEIKKFLVRTAMIESYINVLLGVGDDSIARAYVRLRTTRQEDKCRSHDNPYDYYFDVTVGNDTEQLFIPLPSLGSIFTCLMQEPNHISEMLTYFIAGELLEHLFMDKRRNESNEQINAAINSDLSCMAEQKTIPPGGDENGKS